MVLRTVVGAVLIVALIVIAVLASMVLVLSRSMRVEVQAAGNQAAAAQVLGAEARGRAICRSELLTTE